MLKVLVTETEEDDESVDGVYETEEEEEILGGEIGVWGRKTERDEDSA